MSTNSNHKNNNTFFTKSNYNNGIININNTEQNIKKEFELLEDIHSTPEEIIRKFFKEFSNYITDKKVFLQKIKVLPELYNAKEDSNIAKIYEKNGKLYVSSSLYENEFDLFFTQVNRHKEQKRKERKDLKNGSLVYDITLYETIYLQSLKFNIYEDVNITLNNELGNKEIFTNINNLSRDNKLIFDLNQEMFFSPLYKKNVPILFLEDNHNIENSFFNQKKILIEIDKSNSFELDNISLLLLRLSNSYHNRNKLSCLLNRLLSTIDNCFTLDIINYFNNIYTPKIRGLFSHKNNYKFFNNNNIEIPINEDELVKNIKNYFEEETIKEINKEYSITQNFTHFYIEGEKFSKDNLRKIISFLTKENYLMFAWNFNKEDTKKLGLVYSLFKVGNYSDKVWFYINTKKYSNTD